MLLSWDAFHRDARTLAQRLAGQDRFSAIVAIARGGLVPAAIVARELGIRMIEAISVASYQHEHERGMPAVLKALHPDIAGDGTGILVVDDLVDTGQTAALVRTLLPRAHVATVYAKPAGLPYVDTFVTEVAQTTWIYFPWDLGTAYQPPLGSAT